MFGEGSCKYSRPNCCFIFDIHILFVSSSFGSLLSLLFMFVCCAIYFLFPLPVIFAPALIFLLITKPNRNYMRVLASTCTKLQYTSAMLKHISYCFNDDRCVLCNSFV